MIAYRKTSGRAHDVRLVGPDYVAATGEILIEGDALPPIESLHDAPTVADTRAKRWEEIKAARDAARDGGFMFNGKLIQSDPISRDNIAGAALAAQLAKAAGQPYAVVWTCADNSVMELNADQVIGMFLTGAQAVQAIYARGVARREQLAVADSIDEVEAVGW